MKIPVAKAAVEKGRKNRENTGMATDGSQKQERSDRWRKEWGQKKHFASLMGLCHFQKYKGRVVLRGDIVKDDSGSYAVFTEEGSSASKMTAAKVMDIISSLPGCAEQVADAVSAYIQVKMEGKKEVIDETRMSGATFHFASLMDICHLKNAELETKHQKIRRSSCTRRRHCERWFWILCSIHWTGIISISNDGGKSHRLPKCARQAADAVSACTQVNMEDAPKLLKIPKSACPDIWVRLPKHK